MKFLRVLPVIVSALLIAAHFFRVHAIVPVVISVAFPLLLLWRSAWAVRLVEVFLVLAGLEWIHVLVELAATRRAEGGPWLRLVVILGAVALFTWASALGFYSRALREWYGLKKRDAAGRRGRPES